MICNQEKPFKNVITHECLQNCNIKEIMNNICILEYEKKDNNNNKENTIKLFLDNIELGFTSGDYDTSNLENGNEEIFENEEIKVTFTTTDNQKDKIKENMTTIDLGIL